MPANVGANTNAAAIMIGETAADMIMGNRLCRVNTCRENRAMTDFNRDAVKMVKHFLGAMEARDLEKARRYLDSDFAMVFPGGVEMRQLEELVKWSKPRYRSVAKKYERFDVAGGSAGPFIVYAFGTLEGERLDGTRFSGIRFIDRFEIRADADGLGLITDQKVWNDLGEVEGRS